MFRSTDGNTILDSKMAPKLTWGRKKRAASGILGCCKRNADIHPQTSAQTVVSDVSKDGSAVIFTVKLVQKQVNEGTTIRLIQLAPKILRRSHRTGNLPFFAASFWLKKR